MREVRGIDATLGKRQGKREEMDEAERSSGGGGRKEGEEDVESRGRLATVQ